MDTTSRSARSTVQARSIAVLITCHNRKNATVASLARLMAQPIASTYSIDVFVVDAGSTDGTRELIRSRFPGVVLIEETDAVYWTQGTAIAMRAAVNRGYDLYLWLNDDVVLDDDSLSRLLAFYEQARHTDRPDCIVTGAMVHPENGELVYGGMVQRRSLSRVSLIHAPLSDHPQRVATMNGNLVLIPHDVAVRVGPLEPRFTQNRGDTDYGLRARRLNISIWQAPGRYGTCMPQPPAGRWDMASPTLGALWASVLHIKEAPPSESMVFLKRHAGPFWPFVWLRPYLKGVPMTMRWLYQRASLRTHNRLSTLRTGQE